MTKAEGMQDNLFSYLSGQKNKRFVDLRASLHDHIDELNQKIMEL